MDEVIYRIYIYIAFNYIQCTLVNMGNGVALSSHDSLFSDVLKDDYSDSHIDLFSMYNIVGLIEGQ